MKVIGSQYCVCSCHTTTRISHKQTHAPSLLNLPRLRSPFHPSRLSQSPGLSSLCPYSSFPLAVYFTHGGVYMSALLSQFAPPSPSPAMSKVCSLCLSIYSCPANRIICITLLDSIYIYVLTYKICFSLTYFTLCNRI